MVAMESDLMSKCDMCKKEKKNIFYVPSRSQLIFGPFPGMFVTF